MSKFQQGHIRASKLSPLQVQEILHLYQNEGWTQGRLARAYRVSVGQVGRIVRGESWQQYSRPESDKEVEHQAVISSSPPVLEELEASMHSVLEKLKQPEPVGAEPDPLEAMLNAQGDPIGDFRRKQANVQQDQIGSRTDVSDNLGGVSEELLPKVSSGVAGAALGSKDNVPSGLDSREPLESEADQPNDGKERDQK